MHKFLAVFRVVSALSLLIRIIALEFEAPLQRTCRGDTDYENSCVEARQAASSSNQIPVGATITASQTNQPALSGIPPAATIAELVVEVYPSSQALRIIYTALDVAPPPAFAEASAHGGGDGIDGTEESGWRDCGLSVTVDGHSVLASPIRCGHCCKRGAQNKPGACLAPSVPFIAVGCDAHHSSRCLLA